MTLEEALIRLTLAYRDGHVIGSDIRDEDLIRNLGLSTPQLGRR